MQSGSRTAVGPFQSFKACRGRPKCCRKLMLMCTSAEDRVGFILGARLGNKGRKIRSGIRETVSAFSYGICWKSQGTW
jgi:hypothetical protein